MLSECSRGQHLARKQKGTTASTTKRKSSTRSAVSTSSPLGMLTLYLLGQWSKSPRTGIVFLAEDESRAERIGSLLHSLDCSSGVLVFPRLNTLPFDGLEPSREIAGRRSSVLRRLAETRKPVFLVSTAEAIMERLPMPGSWKRLRIALKVGDLYGQQDLQRRLEHLGYDIDEEAEYPGSALFHGKTFEIFPAGALNPFRIEHSKGRIENIVAVDPREHAVLFEANELVVDPMSERLANAENRRGRATLPDYCARARWIADAGAPGRAESWLNTINEAASRKEVERDYLAHADWKRLAKRMTVLPRRAPFAPTPEFSKTTAPRKALRTFVENTRRTKSRLFFV